MAERKKPSAPELIEDGELDESGGGLSLAATTEPESSTSHGWPSKISWPSGDLKIAQPSDR